MQATAWDMWGRCQNVSIIQLKLTDSNFAIDCQGAGYLGLIEHLILLKMQGTGRLSYIYLHW